MIITDPLDELGPCSDSHRPHLRFPARTAAYMIDEQLAENIAIVTGGAGAGIGSAVVRRLIESDVSFVVTESHGRRCHDGVHQLNEEFPLAAVTGYSLDAGDAEQIDEVFDVVNREIGPMVYLVKNAAVN